MKSLMDLKATLLIDYVASQHARYQLMVTLKRNVILLRLARHSGQLQRSQTGLVE